MTATKPATPLPWHVGAATALDSVDGQRGIWAGKWGIADVYGQAPNSAYIAHACNAYPELVAALRMVALKGGERDVKDARFLMVATDARALLAKLGESV